MNYLEAVDRGERPPPTLKYKGTSYVLVPHFYHNIYFDWLVPPIYKIYPARLILTSNIINANKRGTYYTQLPVTLTLT